MIKQELFHRTVYVLVKAYQNDTLMHGNCYACAVGNVVAAAMDREVIDLEFHSFNRLVWNCGAPLWQKVFNTVGHSQIKIPANYSGSAKFQIDATGYSWEELATIEKAFESAPCPLPNLYNSDQHQIDGLLAVVDALMEIHQASIEEAKDAKSLFVRR